MNERDLRKHMGDLQIVWDALVRRDEIPSHADAIVIGGCRDTGLAERAAELYHDGVSDLIVVTGYQPEYMDTTEAELLAGKCIELGVPESAIVLEKEATNTGQNIRLSATIVKKRKPDAKPIILIHKPYMSLRFLATAEAQWPAPQPTFYATCQAVSFEEYVQTHGLEDTAWKMLGDLKRMDNYAAYGHQTPQTIPEAAREAYDKIVAQGFTTR